MLTFFNYCNVAIYTQLFLHYFALILDKIYTRHTTIIKSFEICTNVSFKNEGKNKFRITKNSNNASRWM